MGAEQTSAIHTTVCIVVRPTTGRGVSDLQLRSEIDQDVVGVTWIVVVGRILRGRDVAWQWRPLGDVFKHRICGARMEQRKWRWLGKWLQGTSGPICREGLQQAHPQRPLWRRRLWPL